MHARLGFHAAEQQVFREARVEQEGLDTRDLHGVSSADVAAPQGTVVQQAARSRSAVTGSGSGRNYRAYRVLTTYPLVIPPQSRYLDATPNSPLLYGGWP